MQRQDCGAEAAMTDCGAGKIAARRPQWRTTARRRLLHPGHRGGARRGAAYFILSIGGSHAASGSKPSSPHMVDAKLDSP